MPDNQRDESTEPVENTAAEENLLKQCRDDFRFHKSFWTENYEEAKKDMRYAAAMPPREFVDDRKGKACIWPDEISQYIKQANNNLRQNKRSIKISAKSDATAQDAEHRQAYIRGIEDASKAQSIYTTGYESAAQCGFGYWRVTLRVTGPKGEQEPRLVRIPNQFTVWPDPEAKEADRSDQMRCFVTETMRQTTFARKYPKAKKRSFTGSDTERASDFFSGDNITVAEYWVREESDDEEGQHFEVRQYITNGVEFLKTKGMTTDAEGIPCHKWIGTWIPIIGVYGEELYIDEGGQSKLKVLSLIRRARDPQHMLAYVASKEADEIAIAPIAPYLTLAGTVDDKKGWADAHRTPFGHLDYEAPVGWDISRQGPPPMPSRNPFTPNIEAYEVAGESWRRRVQSAMGIAPLPTAALRQNEKSGIALEKIQNQEAIGAFHITDNFVRALGNTGRQINELITELSKVSPGLPEEVLGKDQKGEDINLRVIQDEADEPADSEEVPEHKYLFAHRGQFEVTVGDGANHQSEREEASEFADQLLETMPQLGLPPALTQEILAIAVKLKNIGTYGDEIADLLAPPDQNALPPKARAILAQATGQVQMLQQELQQLKLEKMGKVIEIQGKQQVEAARGQTAMDVEAKRQETQVLIAEINTKAQDMNQRMDLWVDMMKQWHQQAHEIASQMMEHKQAMAIAQQQAATASAQSAQDHAQGMAATAAQPAPAPAA